jgi:hypothetical protein
MTEKYPSGLKNFWNIAKNEAIYRLDENKKMNCSCLGNMEEGEKLKKFLKQLKKPESIRLN